jgi:hypothetical protein
MRCEFGFRRQFIVPHCEPVRTVCSPVSESVRAVSALLHNAFVKFPGCHSAVYNNVDKRCNDYAYRPCRIHSAVPTHAGLGGQAAVVRPQDKQCRLSVTSCGTTYVDSVGTGGVKAWLPACRCSADYLRSGLQVNEHEQTCSSSWITDRNQLSVYH